MRILLTGANGQVGWEIAQRTTKHDIIALDRAALDITQPVAVQQTLADSAADLVINAAAYTGVDRAEQEPDLAFAANRDGPAHLAAACARFGIPLFHISTDYVFDGNQSTPYREDDPVAPLGVYGRSKWEGEEAVRRVLPAHLILRVSWVFGRHGHNFVKTMLRLAREREQLRVVADQHGCPTYAGSIADVFLMLADRLDTDRSLRWGTYHYCNTPATTWHGFTEAIVALARDREPLCVREVVPITTSEYPTPAARPANSVLDCSRLREYIAIAPGLWQAGLRAM
ncbi:MAG: dTDP-4-dehydrorhamnose reductase [Candidatus Competibacteraceae bacterium]|nr:dTDP-4-dehydrorhamnose reductase [Candidatus Competibacteraceae bacterium]